MDSLYFTEEHRFFRDSFRDFLQKEVVPHIEKWEETGTIDRFIWEKMGEMGYFGISYPEAFGGMDLDIFYLVIYLEELQRVRSGGFAAAMWVHPYLAMTHILAEGSEAIKDRYLPDSIAGKKIGCLCITEPFGGSDVSGMRTTAIKDGDEWVINGEKIYVTDGERSDTLVVWATLDKSLGKAAIKSFIVEKGTPGCEVTRLEHKMGIRASDTAAITFSDCRVPRENILGSPDIATDAESRKKAFGGVMQTFDNTRPPVAAMAIGVARAALDLAEELLAAEGVTLDYDRKPVNLSALEAALYEMEADWQAARLLVQKAAWMADNRQPNSMEASMCKAKAGRMGNEVTLRCVELCQGLGYSEQHLLEKFARDSKILDIFEGTQQIQQLIVARRLLGKSSSELK